MNVVLGAVVGLVVAVAFVAWVFRGGIWRG